MFATLMDSAVGHAMVMGSAGVAAVAAGTLAVWRLRRWRWLAASVVAEVCVLTASLVAVLAGEPLAWRWPVAAVAGLMPLWWAAQRVFTVEDFRVEWRLDEHEL
ncbi:hypothetical protein ACWDUL_38390 [Nocardia niigatensis]